MENNSFRASIFGGFNRRDVIEYLEKYAAQCNERIDEAELEKERLYEEQEELKKTIAEQQRIITEQQGQIDNFSNECRETETTLAQANEKYEQMQDMLRRVKEEMERLHSENQSLQEEIDSIRPLAEEYSAMKSHIAELELNARARAEAVERMVRVRLNESLSSFIAESNTIFATLRTTCQNLSSELRMLDHTVSNLPDTCNALKTDIDALILP